MIVVFPSSEDAVRFFLKYGNDTRMAGIFDGKMYTHPLMPYSTEMWLRDRCTIEFFTSNVGVEFYKQKGDGTEEDYIESRRSEEIGSMFVSPCDSCRYRQNDLDPEGCFKQVQTTGLFGRLISMVFGCQRYGYKSCVDGVNP